jgi:hypothetical protein
MSASAPTSEAQIEKRRTKRLLRPVPITVTGTDALGQPFREPTTTVMVDCYGCKYASKHYAPKESMITLEIPYSQPKSSPRIVHARVVWVQRPRTSRENYQVAVALMVPGNVWGVADPPADWFPHPDDEELVIPASSEVTAAAGPDPSGSPGDLRAALATIDGRKSFLNAAEVLVAEEMKLLFKRLDGQIQEAVDATAKVLLDRITSRAAKDISDESSKHAAAILEEAQKACQETAAVLDAKIRQLLHESTNRQEMSPRKKQPARPLRQTSKRKR